MPQQSPAKSNRYVRLVPLIVILVVSLLGAFLLRDQLSFEALRDNRDTLIEFRDSHYLATMLGFMLIYTVIVTFSLPGAAIASITGGFLFTMFPGVVLNIVAATTGATLIFLAARWGIGASISERMENSAGLLKKVKAGIDDNQWSFLLMVRLVPVFPFFLVNLALSTVGVPLNRFAITTFLGIIPGSVVYTSVGAGVGEVLERGESPNLGIIFEPHILFPILGLAVLAALPMIAKSFKKEAKV
ncbi:TVP38/TMEM64 family protein [Falsihalocynthiibacter sp. SS001]|uniref:TVP38/TMEM64 family protein n=1 Tax=Falsihalocynthiibacter sp. SS001 TaxID=3349698 RepID=UPI0036D2CF07